MASKSVKHLIDSEELEKLADKKVLPMARALYLFLRTGFAIPQCGIADVSIRKIENLTGFGQNDKTETNIIEDILIPELVRHGVIHYDNSVLFIPGIPICEDFFTDSKLLNASPTLKISFLRTLKEFESSVSAVSGCGGQNLAVKAFIAFCDEGINKLIDKVLEYKKDLSENKIPNANIPNIKTIISLSESCKTIASRMKSDDSQTTHTSPPPDPRSTPDNTSLDRSTDNDKPITDILPTIDSTTKDKDMEIGRGNKGEEREFPFSGENRRGVGISDAKGKKFSIIPELPNPNGNDADANNADKPPP